MKTCLMCNKELAETSFYRTRNWVRYPDGRLSVCKDCVKHMIENDKQYHCHYPLVNVKAVLKECDIPFIEQEWKLLEERYPDSYILGRYIAKMNLTGFKTFRYEDSTELNSRYIN